MPRPKSPRPALSKRTDTGQWRVNYRGRDLAVWPATMPSEEAERRYADILRRVAERPDDADDRLGNVTLAKLIALFLESDESPRSQRQRERYRELNGLFRDCWGDERPDAGDYDAAAHREFKTWLMAQQVDGATRWCRSVINSILQQVRRLLKFGKSRQLCRGEIVSDVMDVRGVRLGDGRETDPVEPAPEGDVAKVLPKMGPAVRALAELQLHSAARAGELVAMRPCDVSQSGPVWKYAPLAHKGSWRGRGRTIYLGKRCQAILKPIFATIANDEFAFSPRREVERQLAQRAAARQTPCYPSHMERNELKRKKNPRRRPGERYTTATYRRAMERACDDAGVPRFTPHQLRHLALTLIRSEHSIDGARVAAGHSVVSMTERYTAAADEKMAMEVAAKFG